ncbi:bifunctional precorrin-2 dehydrogenase/sirohydrochlorin ferrochelatase [Planctomycetota bacterium]|nr:bifunctional precorrin-2 dehydrogenase/sirohydrochlorin ferrochelatase [Planctomycetota bacterium]
MPEMFPVFLKLENRPVLVVGAGKVALRKIEALLQAGAKLRVIAPEICDEIKHLQAEVDLRERTFEDGDCEGAFMVVAATGDAEVNATIRTEADANGQLINAVDDPENCNFFLGGIVRNGDVRIAISTQGKAPMMARRIKEHLQDQMKPALSLLVQEVHELRQRVLQDEPEESERIRIVREFVDDALKHRDVL